MESSNNKRRCANCQGTSKINQPSGISAAIDSFRESLLLMAARHKNGLIGRMAYRYLMRVANCLANFRRQNIFHTRHNING